MGVTEQKMAGHLSIYFFLNYLLAFWSHIFTNKLNLKNCLHIQISGN